jgi:putative hydroxymethylpyrimidine transport system substrate-binding protein
MESADAPFLSQTEAVWQQNIDWMFDQGLISEKPAYSDLVADIDF